jgi:hypothetical protein
MASAWTSLTLKSPSMLKITKLRFIIAHKGHVVLVLMYYLERLITSALNFSPRKRDLKSEEKDPIFMKNSCQLMVSTSKFTLLARITLMQKLVNAPLLTEKSTGIARARKFDILSI